MEDKAGFVEPRLANSIMDMCRQLVSVIHLASRASEKELGLSAAQLFVLQKLQDEKTRSLSEVATLTFTHQTSVSAVVKKLVDKKLVISRPASDDARRLELKISALGKKIVESAPEPVQDKLIRGINALGERDAETLDRLLKVVLSEVRTVDQPIKLFFED